MQQLPVDSKGLRDGYVPTQTRNGSQPFGKLAVFSKCLWAILLLTFTFSKIFFASLLLLLLLPDSCLFAPGYHDYFPDLTIVSWGGRSKAFS